MKRSMVIIFIFLLVQAGYGRRSGDTIPAGNEGMIQKENYLLGLLRRADSIRLADSIRMIIMEKQIGSLMGFDIKRKKELEEEMKNSRIADSLSEARLIREMDSLRRVTRGFPVMLDKDTLFPVYSRIGSVSARERAAFISDRIEIMADDYTIIPDSMKVIGEGGYQDIVYKDKIIISVTEHDALWHGIPQDSLARWQRDMIVKAIDNYRESVSFRKILIAVILSVVVLFCFFILIRLINFLFRKLDNNIIPKIRLPEKWQFFRNYETTQKEKQSKILLVITKSVRWAIYLLLTLIMLLLIANILPQTKRIGVTLLGYVTDPLRNIVTSFIRYIPNIITIIIIFIIFRLIIRLFRYLSGEVSSGDLRMPGFYPEWAKPTFIIIRFFLIVVMIVIIFPFLPGSNSIVFQGISVFIGLVISISSTSIIGNLLAGLVITFMRSFRIGDTIKTGENTGTVIEKSAFVTRMRTFKGEYITIPHSNVLASHVTNYTVSAEDSGLVFYTTITIGYDAPWQRVHQLMINAALATDNILKEPSPFVLQTSLNDYHISYQLNAFTTRPDIMPRIYSELHQHIQDKFNEAGVEILSPMFNAMRDGNRKE